MRTQHSCGLIIALLIVFVSGIGAGPRPQWTPVAAVSGDRTTAAALATGGKVSVFASGGRLGSLRFVNGVGIGHCARNGAYCAFASYDGGLVAVDAEKQVIWSARDFKRVEEISVSPTGKLLAVRAAHPAARDVALLIVDLASKDVRVISAAGREPAWSTDEHRLAFSDGSAVIVKDLVTGEEWRVAIGADRPSLRSIGTEVTYRDIKTNYFMRCVKGQRPVKMKFARDVPTPLRWSSDGEWIMFTKRRRALWSSLNCLEASDVIIESRDGQQQRLGTVCKGAPLDYDWIENAQLIDAAVDHP